MIDRKNDTLDLGSFNKVNHDATFHFKMSFGGNVLWRRNGGCRPQMSANGQVMSESLVLINYPHLPPE